MKVQVDKILVFKQNAVPRTDDESGEEFGREENGDKVVQYFNQIDDQGES